jgi:phosphoglycerate dehydrogenase-like enzyme
VLAPTRGSACHWGGRHSSKSGFSGTANLVNAAIWMFCLHTVDMTTNDIVRIAILDDYQDIALGIADWTSLTGRADVTSFTDHLFDPDDLVNRLASFDVVVLMRERTPFPAELLSRLPQLRLLVTTAMSNASIDITAAAAQGVTVCGTDANGEVATREFCWALIMAVARDLGTGDQAIRAGGWQERIGIELAGSTLGLLGLGRLGTDMARYARAFDMRVIAWSQNLTPERAAEAGAELVDKEELFKRSDIVSIHVRFSDRSRGLVGVDELAALGPRGRLVNTSRGPIVDEGALISALRVGTIAGAALDVFDIEPLPQNSPWRSTPRTLLTPHIGYVSSNSYQNMYRECVEDIVAWLDGAPVRLLTPPHATTSSTGRTSTSTV